MHRYVTIRPTTQYLRSTVPFRGKNLEINCIVLMFQIGEWSFVISQIPKFNSSISWSTNENVFNLRIKFNRGDQSLMTLIRVHHLFLRSICTCSAVPKSNNRVLMAWKNQISAGSVQRGRNLMICMNSLFNYKCFININYLNGMVVTSSHQVHIILPT